MSPTRGTPPPAGRDVRRAGARRKRFGEEVRDGDIRTGTALRRTIARRWTRTQRIPGSVDRVSPRSTTVLRPCRQLSRRLSRGSPGCSKACSHFARVRARRRHGDDVGGTRDRRLARPERCLCSGDAPAPRTHHVRAVRPLADSAAGSRDRPPRTQTHVPRGCRDRARGRREALPRGRAAESCLSRSGDGAGRRPP